MAFTLIFLLGALLRASSIVTKADADRLATFVFSFSLPATILVSLDRTSWTPAGWKLPLAACLVTLPLLAIAWLIAQFLGLPRLMQGSFLLATGLINSVYFAYPVVLATFGEAGLAHAVLFDFGQTVLTLTVIYALAVWHGTAAPAARPFAARVVSAPPLWAFGGIVGLKLMGLRLPDWTHLVLTPLHLTTTPLASLVLGLSISLPAIRQQMPLALLGVGVRMGGGLLLGLAATFFLDLSGLQRAVVVTVAAMPSAVNAVIYAADTRLNEEYVTSVVALSILAGMALLPILPRLARLLTG